MKKIVLFFIACLCILSLFSCKDNEKEQKEYSIRQDDMSKYFSADIMNKDYENLSMTVEKRYEITDDDVEQAIEAIINEYTYSLSGNIQENSLLGFFFRCEYEGKPYEDINFTNYGRTTYNYVEVTEQGFLFPEFYTNLLGKNPSDYRLSRMVNTPVSSNDKVILSLSGGYVHDGESVTLTAIGSRYVDLATTTDERFKKAIGVVAGNITYFTMEEEIDGVTETIQYALYVESIITEEIALRFPVTIPNDYYSEESEFVDMNGKELVMVVVPTGIYRRPTFDDDFVRIQLEFDTEEEDAVAAYKAYVKETMERTIRQNYLESLVWKNAWRNNKPSYYPGELHVSDEVSVTIYNLLHVENIDEIVASYGYHSKEEYFRKTLKLDTEEYMSMSLEEALATALLETYDEQMFTVLITRKYNLWATQDEINEFLEKDLATKLANGETTCKTIQELWDYYKENNSEEYVEIKVEQAKAKDFIYRHTTLTYQ